MPFGLEDHELRAHIDLYERREKRIQKLKMQDLSASKILSTSEPELMPSGHAAKLLPPPPYRAKHIEDTKARAIRCKTITDMEQIATLGITYQEQPPPYTANTSSSTRQSFSSRRLSKPRAEASVPATQITYRVPKSANTTTNTPQVPSSLKLEKSVPPLRQPAAQNHSKTPAPRAARATVLPETYQSNRIEGR
ncbi:hypothetical protein H2200_010557 [Cladophialophora chaetospira]|uniref:Uncharacterized protein n=1 Tax=Cladophialophora chaetospira TaxID=386627 RepID=A0AA39CEF6_9EURO|nr:hypothetical protein H2200_010557 [Cladophialophora chaetospira]